MKKIKNLSLLFLIMIVIESCSLSARLNYHMKSVNNILEKDPSLDVAFDSSFLIRKDSTIITSVLDTTLVEIMDTIAFDSTLMQLLVLEREIDSLESIPNSEEKLYQLRKRMSNQRDIIDELRQGAYKDTTYNFTIKNKVSNSDTSYYENFNLLLERKSGVLSLKTPSIKTTIPTTDTTVNINYNKRFTFWQWIKDERTLFIVALLIILIGGIILRSYINKIIP